MTRIVRWMVGLGNAGAVANAGRLLEQRAREAATAARLAERLATRTARPSAA